MSDAVNPLDFLNAKKVYVPDATESLVDAFVIEAEGDVRYYLVALQGEDSDRGEEFFVIHRQDTSVSNIPEEGVWRRVEPQRTEVTTGYKYREPECYRAFQEFKSATFFCGDDTISITRRADDFGIEKMLVVVRPAG